MPDTIGIIADDLTGANDTALQFFSHGFATEILLDYNHLPAKNLPIEVWATSTESRNIPAVWAEKNTYDACKSFKNNLNIEYFYKKIDSTIRGNIAREILSALEALELDAAVIAPAFVQEGRITIGGYQLLSGVPIERTEAACDPLAPVCESNIVNILKKQVDEEYKNVVALIDFNIVAKGAMSILLKLNELVKSGKKLIVVDSVSSVDMEQIILAIKKCSFKILPTGSAGLAQALALDLKGEKRIYPIKKNFPSVPRLVLSGSANHSSILQIGKLKYDTRISNAYFINLDTKTVLEGVKDKVVDEVLVNLVENNTVVVYMEHVLSEMDDDEAPIHDYLLENNISKTDVADKITIYLSELAKKIKEKRDFILISVGGETSYRCAKALYCENLQVVDTVLPAIPLCLGSNAQLIVTKSGNLGNSDALIDIIKYFDNHV